MSLSEKDIAETVKNCIGEYCRPKMPEQEKSFMERLTKSTLLYYRIRKAKLKKPQIEQLISSALTLNLDYSVFKKRLDNAKRDQSQVQRKAAALVEALNKLHDNPCVTSELQYKYAFLQSLGIKTSPKGTLETLSPLSGMVEHIMDIAANVIPKETGRAAAALYSHKNSTQFASRQFAAALVDSCPKALQKKLGPTIAEIVHIRYKITFRSDNIAQIRRDLQKKKRLESWKKTVDSPLSGPA